MSKPTMNLCRTCLSGSDLKPIFASGSVEQITIKLELATGITIKPDDGYPQKICRNCILALNEALQFRKRAFQAHKAFQKLPALNVKTECKKIKTEVIDDEDFSDDNLNGDDKKFEVEVSIKREEKKLKVIGDFKCKYCQKEFKSVSGYQAHVKAHEFFVVCEECGYKCRNNYVLTYHKRAKHNVAKIHKCQHCDYEGSSQESLTVHVRTHTGEKPYMCDSCGTSFHRRALLVQHIAVHIPEQDKKFKCTICHKLFPSVRFLRTHTYQTHQERRYLYKCIACPNVLRSTNSARIHMLKQHGIPKAQQGKLSRVLRKKSDGDGN